MGSPPLDVGVSQVSVTCWLSRLVDRLVGGVGVVAGRVGVLVVVGVLSPMVLVAVMRK